MSFLKFMVEDLAVQSIRSGSACAHLDYVHSVIVAVAYYRRECLLE